MNRGHLLQSSPVQQMMAGSPNWWNLNNMRPPSQQPSSFLAPPPNLFPQYMPPPPPSSWADNQELPESWSQLLLGGLVAEDQDQNKSGVMHAKKTLENWEEQLLQQQPPNGSNIVDHVKQENSAANGAYNMYGHENAEFHAAKTTWSQMMPVSSPTSCVTTLSSNMLDFSSSKSDGRHPPPDRSSECNSTAIGGASKKARVQPSSTQSSFKVRKEKLGDRITALHQLVSPFGKTDTASVLLEAIGYIRFLQSQIEALSSPYLGSKSGNVRQQQSAQGERNCLFPEDPGQLLNDNCMKRKAASEQDSEEEVKKDLRSRGLCLVPISCTLQVGSDNGADYWAPALGGGFR
ncbi:transcription factor bHLH68-like [Coffea arabica]|uniref:Transcription factor bHLH68-like n=1 Tax=Coffea arabica TaxID=13443 RepID=A0A6P6SR74_COFAR|nr:transcription factor bHLH68-like [Coffea arabica]XP_027072446.1 transcription factor bHLH68-like isoform X1 [Coffea arabica]